jgi:ribosomal protein S18 acetylase RimI-like enzyme
LSTLQTKAAVEVSISDLADLFTRSFEGYIGGPVHIDTVAMAAFLSRENVDLNHSRILIRDGANAGLILISRQGWTSRVAAMGITPEAQSQGVGTWFLGQVTTESKSRGEHGMVLECFEQNVRGVNLYQRIGFTIVRRLYGYDDKAVQAVANSALTEVDIRDVAHQIMLYGASDLPWQVSGNSVARFGPPTRGYQLDRAYAVISDPSQPIIALRALIVPPEYRRKGQATRLIQAIKAAHPNAQVTIPQIFPDEMGINFFEKIGFIRKELNQVQMTLTF